VLLLLVQRIDEGAQQLLGVLLRPGSKSGRDLSQLIQ